MSRRSNKLPVQPTRRFIHTLKRIRWSRGSVLTFATQVRGLGILRAKKSSARLP
jgi:hypothetical protein